MIGLDKIFEIQSVKQDNIAFSDKKTTVSWGEYYSFTKRCINHLLSRYNPTRAVFLAGNRYEMFILMSACSSLRIPLIGVDYTADYERKLASIKQIQADLLFYSAEFAKESRMIGQELNMQICCIDEHFPRMIEPTGETCAAGLPKRPFESIAFTSGTTGDPKAAIRRKSFDSTRFSYLKERFQFTGEDNFLLTLPFYHTSALGWARLFLSLGGKVTLTDFHDPLAMYDDLLKERITAVLIVPPVLEKLIAANNLAGRCETHIKFMIVGGKHFPTSLKMRAIGCFGEVVHEYYGTTETGINTIADSYDLLNYPNSSGKPVDGCDIRIVDDCGNDLGFDNPGRIAVYGYQNMDEYLNQPCASCEISGKRYLLTPDYGYMTADYRLYCMSRNNFLAGGRSINIYEIENRIRSLNAVKDVYVHFDAATTLLEGKILQCYISVNKHTDIEEVRQSLHEKLKNSGLNYHIQFVENIPYSLSGKVKAKELHQFQAEYQALAKQS